MDIDSLREMAELLPVIIQDLERVQELYSALEASGFKLLDHSILACDSLSLAIQQVETLKYKR